MSGLFLVLLVLIGAEPAAAGAAGERRVDRSGDFSYELPGGWKILDPSRLPHDALLLPEREDGFKRNIVITDQKGDSSLEALKQMYERDLARLLKDFELVSSELVELPGKGQAVKIVHTNSMPGIPVRQVNYVIELGGKRYYIAGTTLKGDGARYDSQIEAFVISIQK